MPNRLARSQSLYLRKHADNPIDWYPWDDEALEKARNENKPIFLSIGYSSCHWCTVMEHEAFSDTVIADYMNERFVAIKVDREERPDLDSIYMQAVQIMGESGGWPLNLFLVPDDLVPFYGGTYFPIEPRYGRPGFLRVLQSICEIYYDRYQDIQDYKDQIVKNLHQINKMIPVPIISDAVLAHGIAKCAEVVTNRDYGTCFPMIPYANLLLRASRFESANPESSVTILRDKSQQRGIDLALGGIFDHVAGGWHRYTVDHTWTVPHFEKMLYDNGLIMEYLANLWLSGFQEPAIARACDLTATWLQREMLAEEGCFYASQDADSEGREGKFWVWSFAELKKIFSNPELDLLIKEFTISVNGNFEESNVLQRKKVGELSDETEACLLKLFRQRYGEYSRPTDAFPVARSQDDTRAIEWEGRVPPITDTKAITAWNALMISGLATAYRAFHKLVYKQLAVNAAKFILEHQWIEGHLQRINYEGEEAVVAQSEDYAFLIKALLDLHQALPESADFYLQQAIAIQSEFDHDFWDALSGGYFNTTSESSQHLLLRERNYQDNATPSSNGVAIANLVRLASITGKLEYLDRAELALKRFGLVIANNSVACPSLFVAFDWFRNHTLVRTNADQYAYLNQQYLPSVMLRIDQHLPNPDAIALVCQGFACLEPAVTQDICDRQLLRSTTRVGLN
ncbi:MAG: thioredoxin domain-containing protein [Pseudanabaena sp. M57BS1SP1A06MG]|nr:thioredoxin domain-containing protein [Pseudanabaena sp. M53BS1SP1A06MG]MCA6583582.1 thioredoxin domain-containing protein [Pseudanabaena sp. M34BS1SP1A06MG]MCA6593621.1 thioredoxin domain-containing protein [Pseudanabaena sp. M38BS1SP1A06MG]MCA6601289.1 thioredoxin domain-containing protein [Pseudanabaena sp. M57BS1SP1A06MG]